MYAARNNATDQQHPQKHWMLYHLLIENSLIFSINNKAEVLQKVLKLTRFPFV